MNYGETNRKPEKNERIVIADTIVTIIDNMRKNIDNHMTTIRDFFRSVHQGRQKRSLWEGLNLVSNVAGLIMGGVTNHRIDMLHTQIMESDKLAQRAIEMAGVTTSLLDTVIIRENEIARALERMDEAIGVIDVVVTDLGRRLQLLEKIFLCSSVLENYRAILRGVEENQNSILGGLREANVGRLSPNFITPDVLLSILNTLIKEGVSLIIPPNEENLHTYYFSLNVKLMPGSSLGNLMVYLTFPLPGHQMDAFLVHAFPRPILNSTAFIHTQISAAVLLVSEARDLFVEKRDLIDCKAIQPGWSVCPADAALLRRGQVTTCISPAFSTRRKQKTAAEMRS